MSQCVCVRQCTFIRIISLQSPMDALPLSKYSYQVKVFETNCKRKFIVRQLHHFTDQFTSVDHIAEVLSSEIESDLADDYNMGYFEGRAHSKQWLVSDEDVQAMYQRFSKGGRIVLWCENIESEKEQAPPSKKKKKKEDKETARRQDKEDELDGVYLELKKRHGDKWPDPHLRLWARYKVNGYHTDLDNPPAAPPFNGFVPKRAKQESLSEALASAATAFAQAFSGSPANLSQKESVPSTPSGSSVGMSPLKVADLRMKHLEQLRYLQQLMEDGIISKDEFVEQKGIVLGTLRKI